MATCGSWTATSASSRSSSRMSLCESESRSSSVSALKARPSTATLRPRSEPEPALEALDEEQRHRLVHARDGQQHPRRGRALLGEREVLAQARPGGEARLRHPAARVVAVDQVDDLEDVRAVLLALHHQEVGQREHRVAQDVGPDLRQLGLDRASSARSARRAARTARAAASPDASPTPPTMHGSVPISSKKRPAAIRSGTWATKTSSPDRRGRAASPGSRRRTRSCRGAIVERSTSRWPGAQHGQQVVEHGADVAHVDLDVRERRRAEREHDRVGLRGVGGARRTSRCSTRSSTSSAPGSSNGIRRSRDGVQALGVVVDAEHAQAVVGEGERQRQPDAAAADDRDVVAIISEASERRVRAAATGARTRRRSAGCSAGSAATAAAARCGEPVGPLEADALHPARRLGHQPGVEVERGADADEHRRVEAVAHLRPSTSPAWARRCRPRRRRPASG